jgi:transcriptional regulator with XRE-family HTH domain
MNYAKAIRIARSLADVSQAKLARKASIDRSYLSLIESGSRVPSLDVINKLCNALGMPFHLFALLGVEQGDSAALNNKDIESLAVELAKLLLEGQNDESFTPKNKAKRKAVQPEVSKPKSRIAKHNKSENARSSPGRKARSAA